MSNRRLAFGTLAMGAANFLKIGIQLVMLPLMARLLGPSEYGLYSLAMPIIMFIMMLADGGLGASLAREPEDNTDVWSSAFWALLISGLIMAGAVCASSYFLAAAAHEARLPAIMIALSPCLIMFVISVPGVARLTRQARLEVGAICDVVGNVAGAGCAIVLAIHGAGAWSLVAQTSVIYFVRALVFNVAAPMLPRFHLSLRDLAPHLMIGGTIIGGKLVDAADKSIENAFMGRNFGSGRLGAFSIANQIPAFLCGSVSNALWAALYTQTIRTTDEEEVLRNYRNMIRIMALLLFPMAALAAAEGQQLVALLLGNRWGATSPMLEVFLITTTLSSTGILGQAILVAKGKASVLFRITAETAVMRVLVVCASPWIGMDGLIAGLAASAIYTCWRSFATICRAMRISMASIMQQMKWPALSSCLAGIACWLVSRHLTSGLLPVMLNLLAGSACYFLLLLLFERRALFTDMGNVRRLLIRR